MTMILQVNCLQISVQLKAITSPVQRYCQQQQWKNTRFQDGNILARHYFADPLLIIDNQQSST